MKYELTEQTKTINGRTVYRIRSLEDNDRSMVLKGDLGGWVQSEKNLAQDGYCWIGGDAYAIDMSRVTGNASLHDQSGAEGFAKISGEARMFHQSRAMGHCSIYGESILSNHAKVYGDAEVFGKASISHYAQAHKSAWVYGDVRLTDMMEVTEKTTATPIFIGGLDPYRVTVMDDHINFNCLTKSFDEWINITDRELIEIDGRQSVRFKRRYGDVLLELIKDRHNGNR